MNKTSFTIDGIRNHTEKVQIKKSLDKLEGVREVAIDRRDSTIEIEYNPPTTEEEILECIEAAGHHVVVE